MRSNDPKSKTRFFVYCTNLKLDEELAYILSQDYRKRWSEETGYRVKGEFRAKTKALSYEVRLFLFIISVILFNLWVLLKEIGRGMKAHLFQFKLLLGILGIPANFLASEPPP